MASERKPQVEPSVLSRPLVGMTACAVRFPRSVTALALFAAVGSVTLCTARMGLQMNRLDLVDQESESYQLWRAYVDEFDHQDDVVIVVECKGSQTIAPVLDTVAAEVAKYRHLYRDVLHRIDHTKLRRKGLYYLTAAQVEQTRQAIERLAPVVAGDWSQLALEPLSRKFMDVDSTGGSNSQAPEAPKIFLDSLLGALRRQPVDRSLWSAWFPRVTRPETPTASYLLTPDGGFGFVLLRTVATGDGEVRSAIERLQAVLDEVGGRFPEARIGITGLPVMENAEMHSSQRATIAASQLSAVGVSALFLAGFGGLRRPVLCVLTLAIGIMWTLGYVTLVVGHLNILSMAFGVILIGLGIDFGIHYLARYQELLRATGRSDVALRRTAAGVGPGIVVGGLTSSLAFLTAGLTEFPGIAELGIIAGGGIGLCLLATVLVLPALLFLADRGAVRAPAGRALPLGHWLAYGQRFPRTTLMGSVVLTVLLASGLSELHYDHNLLNLQAEGTDSVQWERRLMAESDRSLWFALSVARDREELRERTARFRALPCVSHVEEIASLLADDVEHKRPAIKSIHERLRALPAGPPQIPAAPPDKLQRLVTQWRERLETDRTPPDLDRRLNAISELLAKESPARIHRRLAGFVQQQAHDLHAMLTHLRSVSNPEPPRPSDLPAGLVRRYLGQTESWLIKVYGRSSLWNMDALRDFVRDVRSVDPEATGHPLQAFEASRQMLRSYLKAGLYSLVAVTLVLFMDLRRVRHVLLAMFPVTLGLLHMFGLLGLLGIPLNPANMIVLPLILGIGIDDGVHVVHDYRMQRGAFCIRRSTATAIVMTSLTSMIGFGSLMIASHRGLESLGRVLTLGVASCLITSLWTLTAWLSWISRRQGRPRGGMPAAEHGPACPPEATQPFPGDRDMVA